MSRVAVTGLGVVSPFGIGWEPLWENVCAGRSAVGWLERFDPGEAGARSRCAAEYRDYRPEDWFNGKECRRLDRFSQFAVLASRRAVADAGLEFGDDDHPARRRCALVFGSALGGFALAEQEHERYLERGPRAVAPSLAGQVFGATAHTQVALDLGLHGPGLTNSNSCAAGNLSVIEALRILRRGEADVVLAGGVEAPLAPLTFVAFDRLNTMSRYQGDRPEDAFRPFDAARDGFVMAEAAATLVIEWWEHAKARGATILAELVGGAHNTEAYHMTSPEPSGRWIRELDAAALADSGLRAEEVDHVNAHGSGTPHNDRNEGRALQAVFGPRGCTVSGTKAVTGHPLGAAGALEAAITVLSIHHQLAPGTLNLENPDPAFELDLCAEARPQEIRVALNHSFGFGGINTATVFRRAV